MLQLRHTHRPWAIAVLTKAYTSIVSAMTAVLVLLTVMRRFERLRELLLVNGMLGLLGIVFCTFLPAVGAYAFYVPAPELVANMPPSAGRYHLEHLTACGAGSC